MAKLTLQCWKCHNSFEHHVDLTNRPAILIPCPFCKENCHFDTERHREVVATVYRHVGGALDAGMRL